MEEAVGKIWHRLVTGAARSGYPEATVHLDAEATALGIFFRALGGDAGLRVEVAEESEHRGRRTLLARIAGTGNRIALGWRDAEALRLPATLDVFPDPGLNRELYRWLAALAAVGEDPALPWHVRSTQATLTVWRCWPGLARRYRDLVEAYLPLRPDPRRLPPDEAAQESALRELLRAPHIDVAFPPAARPPAPVHLWLHPAPPRPPAADDAPGPAAGGEEGGGRTLDARGRRRRRAERVEMPERNAGLLAVRMEALLGFAEYVKVDRGSEEDDDLEEAARNADDMEVMSVARDSGSSASRVRFDLDLPSAASDDTPIGEGLLLPEWDWRRGVLRQEHCRILPMVAADAPPTELPPHLTRSARRLRAQFETLAEARVWQSGQPDGCELDLDAFQRFAAARATGQADAEARIYRDLRAGGRELACLALADLSLSTDAAVNDEMRIVDVVRDTLYLFSEALSATGDRFALYGFSSRRREHVRLHLLKGFEERYDAQVRGRLAAIKPGFYTRMGAAIRYASDLLEPQGSGRRLLLIITDGKPNDLDQYEGRYGVEDTRMAIIEARRRGLLPFCVTIDTTAGDYLPYLFGSGGFVVIRRPEELPSQLPQLYLRLTR